MKNHIFPAGFSSRREILNKIPMGFSNKIQNLPLPLIKLRPDCVSSYYVLLNVFHMILSIPIGYFLHGENIQRQIENLKKKQLILFERILKFKYKL